MTVKELELGQCDLASAVIRTFAAEILLRVDAITTVNHRPKNSVETGNIL